MLGLVVQAYGQMFNAEVFRALVTQLENYIKKNLIDKEHEDVVQFNISLKELLFVVD